MLVWAPADHVAPADYFASLLRRLGYRAARHIVGSKRNEAYYQAIGAAKTKGKSAGAGWVRDYTSAADFLRALYSCSGIVPRDPLSTTNYSRFCDSKVEQAMRAAERSQQARAAGANAWAAVDRMIVTRAPSVPYANDLELTLLSRRVGNYQFNPQWGVLLDQLWVR